tara:strand:- start:897 stop:1304 length:408 start_codon:yes stop_codon:yes gene_type:complete
MEAIVPNKNYENHLMYLLQDIYFDNIDTANADKASEAMHDDVRWVHNQVWEHDANKTNIRDTLNGRKKVKEFLRKRITELQIEGIVHKVENVVSDGKLGAFKAYVIGKDILKKPFFGLVELKDEKIIYYRVLPLE